MADRPAAEVVVDEGLVGRLLAEQHPDLADLARRETSSGWDNVVFRLGDDLAVRLPRRAMSAPLAEHEQRWLPGLAAALPLPIPAPVRAGRPGCGYPWSWSVVPWFAGDGADLVPPADLGATAVVLGAFLAALHRPSPPEAPVNAMRGVPLAVRDGLFRERAERLAISAAVLPAWERACAAPPDPGPARWVHGDLHPGNMVVADGRLAAVLDFGDLTGGDRAVDLAVAWKLLPVEHRSAFRSAAGARDPVDDATWARARGNALAHAVACLESSDDFPRTAAIGRRTLDAVLTDPG